MGIFNKLGGLVGEYGLKPITEINPINTLGHYINTAIDNLGDAFSSNKSLTDSCSGFDNGMDGNEHDTKRSFSDNDTYLSSKPMYGNEKELKYWLASGGKEEDYYRYAENRYETMMSAREDAEDLAIEEGRYDPYSGEITGWTNSTFNNGMD